MTVVLEGGRVGEELGSMALIELGSALAAVTATRDDGSGGSRRDGFTPAWTDHAVPPATPGSTHPASVLRDVPFPSLESARAAVRRCALTRVALLPVAVGSPAEVAAALGPARAARCAAQVLAPGRKGLPRVALERVGAELWDAGVGRDVAADPAWLHALARERRPSAERDAARDEPDDPSSTTETMVYLHPEGILGTVLAWGLDARAALRAVEAPNAMPPEQAVLSANAAHISPGDVAMDPCVGGGAALLASLRLGAARTYGADVDQDALRTAREALRRCDRDEGDGFSKRAVLARASLVDEALDGEEEHAEERNAEGNDDADLDRVDSNDLIGSLGDSRDSGNDLVGSRVDAILTDLPYGVRSAAIGVGSGPDGAVTPGEMLDALLRLARRRLRPTRGRVAAWVQRWDGDGGMSPEEVKTRANEGGFEVERFAAESRKSGVRRALYVLVPRGSGSRRRDPDPSGFLHAGSVLKASAAFGRAEDIERRAALVAHARLRRGENHGRVASSGGADPWRAAWVGDAPTLRRLFGDDPRVASLVAGVAEPAGARNTPLLAAAGFGRTTIVDMVLRARPETTSAELDEALLRAVEFGRAETAETLIQRGADFRAKRPATRGGGEATHAAAERGHVAVLDVLARAAMTSREDAEVRAAMTSKDVEGRDAAGAAARRATPTRSAPFLDTPRPPRRRRRPSRRRRRDGDTSTRFERSCDARGAGRRPRRTRRRARRRRDGVEPTFYAPYASGRRRWVRTRTRRRPRNSRGILSRTRRPRNVPCSGRGRCFATRGRARGCFTRRGFGIRTRDTPRFARRWREITSRETIHSSPPRIEEASDARFRATRRTTPRRTSRRTTRPNRARRWDRRAFHPARRMPNRRRRRSRTVGGRRTGTTPITRVSPRRVRRRTSYAE